MMAKTRKPSRVTRAKAAPKTVKSNGAGGAKPRGIVKQFLKTRPVCKVTFTLPKEAAPAAETVCLVGEFNNWSPDATPMKRRKDGDYVVSLDLERGRAYRFRYLIDGCRFENDWAADRYQPNPYGGEDSVVEA